MTDLEAIKSAARKLLRTLSCPCDSDPAGDGYRCYEKQQRDRLEGLTK